MTSQKSSVKTFSRTFWYTVKSCLYVPAIVASVLTIGVFYLYAGLSTSGYINNAYVSDSSLNVAKDVRFVLLGIGYSNEATALALYVGLAATAVLLAVMIFRFMNSKKTVNVWFGMGISKNSLFYSKLLGGVFLLGAMILIPAAIDLVVNARLFGFSYELMMSWLYLTSGYIVYTLNVFLLVIAVMCVVGTSAEGVVFGGILLLSPTLVLYELSQLMNALTLGSQYNIYNENILLNLSALNPIMFLSEAMGYGYLSRSGDNAAFVWTTPPLHIVALWLCVVAVLAFVAGRLFKRRKTEMAGFWGSSKAMTFVISLDAMLSAFCIGAYVVRGNRITSVMLGLAAAVAVFPVADILLTFNKREWVKNLKMLPVHVTVLAAVGVVFATGFFGYSTRVPAPNSVKEITITPVAYNGLVDTPGGYYYVDDYAVIPSYGYDNYYSTLSLTSDADKRAASELHQEFIKADLIYSDIVGSEAPRNEQILYYPVTIEYTRYDGSKIKRCYNYVPMRIFTAYEALNYGDWYKQMVKTYLTEPVLKTDSENVSLGKRFFQNDNNAVYLASKYLDQSYTLLKLTPEQRKQLLAAVAHDLMNTGAGVKQKPLTGQLATLVFSSDSIEAINAQTDNTEKLAAEETGDLSGVYGMDMSPYYPNTSGAKSTNRYFSEGLTSSVMLTQEMTETIAFLKNNGMFELLNFDVAVESARVMDRQALTEVPTNVDYYYYDLYAKNPPGIQFNGMYTETSPATFNGRAEITDKTVIDRLTAVSYNTYYTDEEVYYVCYKLSGGGYSVLCVPAKLMPAEFSE